MGSSSVIQIIPQSKYTFIKNIFGPLSLQSLQRISNEPEHDEINDKYLFFPYEFIVKRFEIERRS